MSEGPGPHVNPRDPGGLRFVPRPPWYHGWNIIAVCLIFQTLTMGVAFSSYTFLVEQWVMDFDAARSQLALAIMVCSLGASVLGPVAGQVIDKAPIRLLIAGGLVIHAAGLLCISLAQASWQLIAIFGLVLPFGLVFATNLPSQVLAARWFPAQRGLALGIAASGSSLGGILMPPIVNALIDDIGWRGTCRAFAWITVALIVPLVLLIIRNGPKSSADSRAHVAAVDVAEPVGKSVTTLTILRTPNFWILMTFATFLIGVLAGFQITLLAFTAERGISRMETAGLLSTVSLAAIAANFLGGYLADRVEHRLLLAVIGFASAAASCGLAFVHGIIPVGALFLVFGLSIGALAPVMGASLAREFGSAALGRAFGLAAAILALHAVFGPLIAKAHEVAGSFEPILLSCAIFTTGASFLVLKMKYRTSLEEEWQPEAQSA